MPNNRIHGSATPNDILPWPWIFDDKSFYLIVNMAVGGTLGGEVVPGDLPATVEFDWIRVYPEGVPGWEFVALVHSSPRYLEPRSENADLAQFTSP